MERFVASDWRAAIGHFTRAYAQDSSYTLPLVVAAVAWANLGNFAAVDSLAGLVERHRAGLAEYDRQAITAAVAWGQGDYTTSYRAAKRVAELAPNTIPHAQVARELLMQNRPREALRVFRELDPKVGELRGWLPYWNNLASAHHLLADYRSELEVAHQAVTLFPDNAGAVQLQARALIALGRDESAMRFLDDRLARLEPGSTSALLMRQAALELDAHGNGAAARRLLTRSLDWYLDAPQDVRALPAFRRGLGEALYLAGELDEAESVLTALATGQADDVALQGRLGTLAARQGDRAGAERISAWLAALERPYLLGAHTLWRARISALLGDADRATDLVRDAYAQGRSDWIALHVDPDLASLRGNRRFRSILRSSD
jgi:tetratricopeptide (TPR) repeat protein